MSNRNGKDLLSELESRKLIEFGKVIMGDDVRTILGIEYPDFEGMDYKALKRALGTIALAEMAAIDYVRNVLLGRGMYLKFANENYRILIPSENKAQIEQYISSADRKLSRALKLSRNSPVPDSERRDCQMESRIMLKRSGMRHAPAA